MRSLQALKLSNYDLICFSHLRWDFIFQRPQHLLTRFQNHSRVFYFEEPVITQGGSPHTVVHERGGNIQLIVPHLPQGLNERETSKALESLVAETLRNFQIERYAFWYYTPLALKFTVDFKPAAVIYDCMDELSAFKFAHSSLPAYEKQLMKLADVVFTGGHSLYEAKQDLHNNIFPVPSSIDQSHFAQARHLDVEPEDQKAIPHPRLGYYGAVDERVDYDVIDQLAKSHPDWSIVIVGPVVKVDPAELPRHANIFYLGSKSYSELPSYLAGWDVAIMPFAINESTKFISPTKTPEYLAGGKPVVSSAIRDVVRPYGEKGFVYIAKSPTDFIAGCEEAVKTKGCHANLKEVDAHLALNSWDQTFAFVAEKIYEVLESYEKRMWAHVRMNPMPNIAIPVTNRRASVTMNKAT